MSKKQITLGVDLSAYTTLDLPDDTDMSVENLKAIAITAYDNGGYLGKKVEFEEDWSTQEGLRIVHAKNGDEQDLSDIPVHVAYYDAGQNFSSWAKGRMSLQSALAESSEFLDLDVTQEVHEAVFAIKNKAAVRVSFECRKGATKEEKDLAMLAALIESGEIIIGSVCIGERA